MSEKSVAAEHGETAVFRLNGLWVSYAHTACAGGAFVAALVVGCMLHFNKIVTNEYYSYPDEWFPSVSATIGDRYPERSIYQLLIALTSGPRFLMVGLSYILTARPNSKMPLIMAVVGALRTFTCGGWTYVTSTDDHDWHDIFMISYIVLTIPWTVLRTILSKPGSRARKYRRNTALLFFAMLVPLVYFFIQHKVHRVAGAYTIYAFFEWSLIALDVGFDAGTAYDFTDLEITVVDRNAVVAQPTNISVLLDPKQLISSPGYLGFVVSVVNWFVFWSVFTSLGALIWYFPLWYMGISGYEVLILSVASPAVLGGIGPLRRLISRYPQLALVGQAIGGIAAYWVPSPSTRLIWVSFGTACGFLALFSSLTQATRNGSRPAQSIAQSASVILGLILSAIAKIFNYTNNPIWPIVNETTGGLNAWGLAIALAAAALSVSANTSNAPADVFDKPVANTNANGTKESALYAGLGVGSLMFVFITYLADTSALPLWVWEGYPIRGPTPVPHGLITLFGMGLGLYLGITRRRSLLSKRALVLANVAFAILCVLKHWVGYAGGLYLAVYSCGVAPALFEAAGRHGHVKAFGLGSVVTVSLMLAETWAVAYAFVPGGFLLRERTWLLMVVEAAFLSLGVINARKVDSPATAKFSKSSKTSVFAAATAKVIRATTIGIVVLLALGSLVTFQRLTERVQPEPVHGQDKILTTGIWTVHFGLDNDMWASETRMSNLIADAELDVIGLLETDTQRIIGGHRDMTQQIAEQLGFYADYGPGPNKHTWGAALLSRYPIVNSTHYLTPSPVGELAPAIRATLDVHGEFVDIVVFHSGQEEDPEDRRLQTETVSGILGEIPRPAILLSYLVTKPLEGNYNTWVSERSGMRDIDPTDDDRWCEYILYKGLRRLAYARVSRSTITDTELQIGRFVVGEQRSDDEANVRIDESQVPEQWRLPSVFRGEGVRGHQYHVFEEPRYFA